MGGWLTRLRAAYARFRGTEPSLPGLNDPARAQFEKEFDAMLVETAHSVEAAAERPKRSNLRLIA